MYSKRKNGNCLILSFLQLKGLSNHMVAVLPRKFGSASLLVAARFLILDLAFKAFIR